MTTMLWQHAWRIRQAARHGFADQAGLAATYGRLTGT
jgi:hypothetical protein